MALHELFLWLDCSPHPGSLSLRVLVQLPHFFKGVFSDSPDDIKALPTRSQHLELDPHMLIVT